MSLSKVPKAFASVEEYNAFLNHRDGTKTKLLREASDAIAWGMPDRECRGYTPMDFIDLISRLRNYIERNT